MKTIINRLMDFLAGLNISLFSRIKADRGASMKNVFALFSVIEIETGEDRAKGQDDGNG